MKVEKYDSIVVLGGGLNKDYSLPENIVNRMETTIDLWAAEHSENIIVSGGHSFRLTATPRHSEAFVMKGYLEKHNEILTEQHVPVIEKIFIEDKSLDTIGNALYTKQLYKRHIPQKLGKLIIVTSRTQMPRQLEIFQRIMGNDIEVKGKASTEIIDNRAYRLAEIAASNLIRMEVFRGTKPGNDLDIQDRLFDLIPGYSGKSNVTEARLIRKILSGIVKFPK